MTYIEGMAGLQYVAEAVYGVALRAEAAREDARFARSVAALRKDENRVR